MFDFKFRTGTITFVDLSGVSKSDVRVRFSQTNPVSQRPTLMISEDMSKSAENVAMGMASINSLSYKIYLKKLYRYMKK